MANLHVRAKANRLVLTAGFLFAAALLLPAIDASAQERPRPTSKSRWTTSQTADDKSKDAEPTRAMIIGMKTGESHLTKPARRAEVKTARWFELETASISTRYHFIDNSRGVTTANNSQYQVTFKGKLRFDRESKYGITAGVFTGNSFNGGWNASGWGTGRGQGNLFLKQLYLSAKPAHGVELQYGGLYFEYGESTEITSYDFDGYVTGQRLKLTRPQDLFFDEVSVTYGYVGDLSQPGVNKRFHRLKQSNYHQFLVARHVGERTRVSADYTFESGVDTFREAIKMRTPELRVIDTFHFENYQRVGVDSGYGFGVYGEKTIHAKFSLGGGFARIDRSGLNSDRFPRGKRFHFNVHLALSPEFSLTISFTQAIANNPATLPRTRLDLAIGYSLLQTLRKTNLF